MRIKSYFAASVQAAIGVARQEFGNAVTLVTSHVAGPDARHLGQYEVVFAVEDLPGPVAEPLPEAASEGRPAFHEFQQLLLAAVESKPAVATADRLDRVREALIDLGLDPATISAIITLAGRSVSHTPTEAGAPVSCERVKAMDIGAPVVCIESGRHPQLSAAEISFISAVAGSPGAVTVQDR